MTDTTDPDDSGNVGGDGNGDGGSDAPSDPYAYLRTTDLGPVIAAYGELTLERADDPFRRFVVSIVNQQLSSASAAAVRDRLFEALDDEMTPDRVLAADDETLREAGLSSQKVGYVRNVAEGFRAGEITPEALADLGDDAALDALTAVRGVGDWTAKMYLLFVLGREDVFPVEDLGIRGGMAELYGVDRDDRSAMVEFAEAWRPFRSYAALYLWHHYEDGETDVGVASDD